MFMTSKRDDENHHELKEQFMHEPNPLKYNMIAPPQGLHVMMNPSEFVKAHFGADSKNYQFRKGTTTLGFIYEPATPNDKGGVVIAVDSRASAGQYIASATVDKILDINDKMVATMAGGAADCQFWIRVVAKYCNLFELREKMDITVSATSKYFANVMYGWRGQGLSVGSMIAGYDKRGPGLFYIDQDGQRLPMNLCSIGSGSLNAYGILDTQYKPKMTDEEALKLGRRAIMHATYRDAGSGGYCTVVHITSEGKTRYPRLDVSELYKEFAHEIRRDIAYEPKDEQ
ncbi:Proteasome endopeptidase complex [Aphelenchoides bicaudatus]|nr:Proteasome endopeptidase complex [Aphelenchoides bicaudatus]